MTGSCDLPRFSCANHKIRTVMNSAMKSQTYLLEICKKLSKSNTDVRNCILKNKIFRELKCRPRIYQKTRWCAAFLLLISDKRAYDKGAFDNNIQCPVDNELIEIYLQILLPAYQVTLGFEKNRSSIADVIPAILYLIHVWEKMDISDPKAKELCYFLVHFMKLKFKYELES